MYCERVKTVKTSTMDLTLPQSCFLTCTAKGLKLTKSVFVFLEDYVGIFYLTYMLMVLLVIFYYLGRKQIDEGYDDSRH